MKTLKNTLVISFFLFVCYFCLAVFIFAWRNNKVVESINDCKVAARFGKVVQFRNTRNISVIPADYVNFNSCISNISLKSGLNEGQQRVLFELLDIHGLKLDDYGPADKLVSLGKTVNRFAEELQSDSLNNHSGIPDVEFQEIRTWKKVAARLNEFKYQ